MKHTLILLAFLLLNACDSYGQLTILGNLDNTLKEVSAAEYDQKRNFVWVIEDSGNKDKLYGISLKGHIIRSVHIENGKNHDWEDLTQDSEGNIYIGDFGNNDKKRDHYKILKIHDEDLDKESAEAEIIEFTLPKNQKAADFESFFIVNNSFYLFSKSDKNLRVFQVPNIAGKHTSTLTETYRLERR